MPLPYSQSVAQAPLCTKVGGARLRYVLAQLYLPSMLAQRGGRNIQPGQFRNCIVSQWFPPVQTGCVGTDAGGYEFLEFSVFWHVAADVPAGLLCMDGC
jgi:hypothetical protein